jgi:hypothetical protein
MNLTRNGAAERGPYRFAQDASQLTCKFCPGKYLQIQRKILGQAFTREENDWGNM